MSTVDELIKANPFPGLRSFMFGEADRFFGREKQIDELAAKLNDARLLTVAGASGCGKSSLVIAGLLNHLARNWTADGSVEWRPFVFRPGDHPIRDLAAGLAKALDPASAKDENRVASLEGRLRLGGRGLAEIVRLARLESHARVLVVVDQFEEIFRFKRMIDPEEAAAFVKLLSIAAAEPDSHVSVVLTLRSDQFGYCADFDGLPEVISCGQYLVPKLTREQRKDAIVKPVELRRFRIAPRLVQRILNDVTSDFDDLPIMQHALTRTWRRWAEACQGTRQIDVEDYEATGGAKGALSKHADEAYDSLIGLGAVVERVFRALTELTGEGEIRRPLNLDRLCAVAGNDRTSVEQVVERFRRPDTAFLMPPQERPLATNPVIDISHESLIRQWGRLRDWALNEAKSRAELMALVDAAGRRYEQKVGELWRGRDVKRVLEWWEKEKPTAAWVGLCTGGDGESQWKLAEKFLAACKWQPWLDMLWWVPKSLLTYTVIAVAVGVGLLVLDEIDSSIHSLNRKSKELSNKAQLEINRDAPIAARLALESIDRDPSNMEAELALRQALATMEIAHVAIGEPIADARFTSDRSRLVVAGGKGIKILDARSYKVLGAPFLRGERLQKGWLIAEKSLLVTLTAERRGEAHIIDGGSTSALSCDGDHNAVMALAVSRDERRIAVGCLTGEIKLWDVKGAGVEPRPSFASGGGAGKAVITALAFSPGNEYLASGDADGAVNIWKLGTTEPWIGAGRQDSKQSPIKHSAGIRDIAFHPSDSKWLATASDDNTASVWKLDLSGRKIALEKKGDPSKWTLKHDRPVIGVRFTPRKDAAGQLMTFSGKSVFFWQGEEKLEARGHDDWVLDANMSDDGELAVSASKDGTARVWSTRSGTPIAVLRGHRNWVTHAFFSPDGKVVTTSLDGDLRVWRLQPPLLLASNKKWMFSAAFDPKGERVALCGEKRADSYHCSITDLQDVSRRQSSNQVDLEAIKGDAVRFASWSADGRLLLGVSWEHGVYPTVAPVLLWDAESPTVKSPDWLGNWRFATFSFGRNELLTVKSDGSIAVWDASALKEANPQPKREFGPAPGRWWAEMSPNGQWIAAIEGNRIALFDIAGPGLAPRMLEGHGDDIQSVKFSPDSLRLVTASADGTARVWPLDPGAGEPIVLAGGDVQAGGRGAALSSAAFSHDGRQVVTGSADNTIRVWDAQNRRELAVLRWHGDSVNDVKFDQYGNILSASSDGTVKLGRCDACNQTIEQLRERVRDEAQLSDDELAKIQAESR